MSGNIKRAPLAVRIALGLVAALALAFAALTAVNLVAMTHFNQATASLQANIAAAGKPDADLATLAASQQQTDAQFGQAGSADPVLLPQLRESIESNTAVSRTLSERLNRELARQQGSDSSKTKNDSSESGTGKDGTGKNSGSSGLSDEQRRKVEEMLKANQRSTPAKPGTSGDSKQDGGASKDGNTANKDVKPW